MGFPHASPQEQLLCSPKHLCELSAPQGSPSRLTQPAVQAGNAFATWTPAKSPSSNPTAQRRQRRKDLFIAPTSRSSRGHQRSSVKQYTIPGGGLSIPKMPKVPKVTAWPQSKKFPAGQSRKFLSTAENRNGGTNCGEPGGTGLAGMAEAGARRRRHAAVLPRRPAALTLRWAGGLVPLLGKL